MIDDNNYEDDWEDFWDSDDEDEQLEYVNYRDQITDFDRSHISDMSIYDFLLLLQKKNRDYKLAGIITSKQSAIQIARGDLDDHWSMSVKIDQAVFPDRDYNHKYNYRDAIGFFALGNSISVELPDRISIQQYKLLLDIFEQVKRYEQEFDRKVYLVVDDDFLKKAKEKIDNFYPIENDEKIVGTPIDENILINSINQDLDIDNCKSIDNLLLMVKKIIRYYEDSFFKNIIKKIIPKVDQIFNSLCKFSYHNYDLSNISININNLTYDNIDYYLQQILSKVDSWYLDDNNYEDDWEDDWEDGRKDLWKDFCDSDDEDEQLDEMFNEKQIIQPNNLFIGKN